MNIVTYVMSNIAWNLRDNKCSLNVWFAVADLIISWNEMCLHLASWLEITCHFCFSIFSFLKSIKFIEQFKSIYLFIFLVFTTTFRLLYFPTIFRCRLYLVAFLECHMEVFISSILNLSSMLPFQGNFITSFFIIISFELVYISSISAWFKDWTHHFQGTKWTIPARLSIRLSPAWWVWMN